MVGAVVVEGLKSVLEREPTPRIPKRSLKRIKNVFLLSPPFLTSQYTSFRTGESLGIRYIASFLEMYGHEVSVIEPSLLHLSIRSTAQLILKNDYDLVGFSVPNGRLFPNVVKTIKILRDNSFDGHITIGGHFPTFEYLDILKYVRNIDSLVRYEGELTILELLDNLDEEKFGSILGLSYRLSNQVKTNPPRPLIKNLDELPFPKRDEYNNYKGHFIMITSRGCYGNCSFCSVRAFYGYDKPLLRQRSHKNIVDEIEYLVDNYDAKIISFLDDNFIGPGVSGKRDLQALTNILKERDLKCFFEISCRPDYIDKNSLILLKDVGLRHVSLGIESGNDQILKDRYNKGTTVSENISALETLRELNLSFTPYFIMFDPFTTIQDIKKNLLFLYKNEICTYRAVKSSITIYKGTQLYEKLKNNLIRFKWGYKYDFMESKITKIYKVIVSLYELDRIDNMIDMMNYKLDIDSESIERDIFSKVLRKITKEYNEFIFKTTSDIINSIDDDNEKRLKTIKDNVYYFEKLVNKILADSNFDFIIEDMET